VVFSCPFLGKRNEENKEAACFDAGHADRSDRPGTVQNEFYLPAPVPAVLLHGRFALRGNCAVKVAPTFVETTMHTHRVFLCLPCMRGRRAVRRAFKHRANHWYNESDPTEDDERTASAFRIGHRAGTAVLPPCSTPQQLTEHQNKNTRRGTAGAFILVELTGVEPVSEKKAVRVSPGAVHLLKFPQCERVHTLDTLVAS
jgi:hypothetical protein